MSHRILAKGSFCRKLMGRRQRYQVSHTGKFQEGDVCAAVIILKSKMETKSIKSISNRERDIYRKTLQTIMKYIAGPKIRSHWPITPRCSKT